MAAALVNQAVASALVILVRCRFRITDATCSDHFSVYAVP
jgi:hypothetical protein